MGVSSVCLFHQNTLTDMQHGLFWSICDLDLMSKFDLALLRSNHISFEVSLRETHDDVIADYLSLLVQKLLVKEYFTRNSYSPFFLTLALVGGSNGLLHGYSRITRVKRGGSPRNLQYRRVYQFNTYCKNFKSMSYQVIKL